MNETVVYKEKEHSSYLKSGFYDSVNHDRKYAAEDMCKMVDGIFSEGVVRNYAEGMGVSTVYDSQTRTTSEIRIGSGKAYVNNRWVEVRSPLKIDMNGQSAGVYHLYLKIDTSLNEQNGRQASFVISTSQTPGTVPSTVKYYKMASFTYTPTNADKIVNFTNKIGDTSDEGDLLYLVVNAIAGNENDHDEIVDARTDFNNITHDSLGAAIRAGDEFLKEYFGNIADSRINLYHSDVSYSFGDIVYHVGDSSIESGAYLYSHSSSLPGTLINPTWTNYWVKLDNEDLDAVSNILKIILGDHIVLGLPSGLLQIYNRNASGISSAQLYKGQYLFVPKNYWSSDGYVTRGLYKITSNITFGIFNAGQNVHLNYMYKTNMLQEIDAIRNSLDYRNIYDVTIESAIPVNSTYTINLPQPYPKDIKAFIANNVVTPASIRLSLNMITSDDDSKPCLATNNVTLGVLGLDIQSLGDFKECLANRPNAGAQGVIVANSNPIKGIEIVLKSDSSNPISAGSRIVVYGKNF